MTSKEIWELNQKALQKIEEGKLDELYTLQWFRNRTKSTLGPHRSSMYLGKYVYERFAPKSVLDLGAGTLAFGNTIGLRRVPTVSVDASEFNKEFAVYTEYVAHNLCNELNLERKFDVVTSWDCFEHIPAASVENLVRTVTNHAANLVLLSIDNSTWGKYHVHCKPKSYWIELFVT
jgi:2-polyprenyl-3-methyl-5-hydroxy-6-metoxy-1,4-benzoquinol methylase